MKTTQETGVPQTPIHLWVVGILALLWGAYGTYDFIMSRILRDRAFLAGLGFDPDVLLAYMDSYPYWSKITWAIYIWGTPAAAILLLMRKRAAAWAFGFALAAFAVTYLYMFTAAPPLPGREEAGAMKYAPLLMSLIVPGLFIYALAMNRRGVLQN